MDDFIRELKEMTAQFASGIDEATDEQLLEFVNRRQRIVDRIAAADTPHAQRAQYKADIEAVLAFDEKIMAKLQEHRLEAMEGMAKMDSARKTRTAYQAEYAYDSVYFDKKK